MAARLLQYRLDTGELHSYWEAAYPALLDAQEPEEDLVYGYLLLDAEDPGATLGSGELFGQWYVEDAMLTAKIALTITATPSPFDADGLAECLVTVAPFVECTLLVNGEPLALTTGDDTLELTSDVPATFTITLDPMVTHWADPLTVEAI